MMERIYSLRRFFIAILCMLPLFGFGKDKTVNIMIHNPYDYALKDAPVVVDLHDLPMIDFKIRGVVVFDGERVCPCQLDDIDSDGTNDELCFLYDLSSKSRKQITIEFSEIVSKDDYPNRLYSDILLNDKKGNHPLILRLEAPGSSNIFNDLYHHGVAFESEITAYRIYFDHRQNIDLYGKRMRRLELSSTGFYTTAEQMSSGYGNDVLWAGNSIGCGSLKLWDGSSPKNWTDLSVRGQRICSCGPVRSVVELTDRGVNIGGELYDIKSIYTQYAGHRDVCVDVYLDKPIKNPILCTGVQKIGASSDAYSYNGGIKDEGFIRGGLAASWGSDYPEMGKKDVFPPEAVGLAVKVDSEYLVSSKTDDLNYLLVIGNPGQQHIRYHISFCAAKENDGYHSASEWFKSLYEWRTEGIDYLIINN